MRYIAIDRMKIRKCFLPLLVLILSACHMSMLADDPISFGELKSVGYYSLMEGGVAVEFWHGNSSIWVEGVRAKIKDGGGVLVFSAYSDISSKGSAAGGTFYRSRLNAGGRYYAYLHSDSLSKSVKVYYRDADGDHPVVFAGLLKEPFNDFKVR